jgi:nitroimidazol reductase NimA-like FMN-containing flavoprotein (pyridoxamine 5'-phosphate oxidase superfamily)
LSREECLRLLAAGELGRIAFSSPSGQQIIPVNYRVHDHAIFFRTTPYSELGQHGPGTEAAFETEELNREHRTGWSVVAKGRLHVVTRHAEVAALRLAHDDPDPWAGGVRALYLKLVWRELTGRLIATDSHSPAQPPVAGGRQIPVGPSAGLPGSSRLRGQPPRW